MSDRGLLTLQNRQVLFERSDDDWYRIPSIAVLEGGVVLAFASLRKGGPGDFGHETDVVLRRSTDGGRTFGSPQTLASAPGIDIHHGPVVVDRHSGRVLKFCRYWPAMGDGKGFTGRIPYGEMVERGLIDHVMVSRDGGATWSTPRPIVLDFPDDATSTGTGNGNHGIQLDDGRLIIQAGFCRPRGERHCCVFLSEDGGLSWRRGATAPMSVTREFAMAQLADGSIYWNFRTRSAGTGCREVSWSNEPERSFGEIRRDEALPEPWSHAGLVHMSGDEGAGTLVFTNPNRRNTDGRHSPELRRELTVRFSFDCGMTWPVARAINREYASYSDLAAAGDTVYCLYENGSSTYRDRITCGSFRPAAVE